MDTAIRTRDLTGIGFTEQEASAVLSSTSDEEQIRLLRKGRGRLLEDIHGKQQALDRLDYFIYQIRQGIGKKAETT